MIKKLTLFTLLFLFTITLSAKGVDKLVEKARIHTEFYRYELALEILDDVLKTEPDNAEANFLAGKSYCELLNFKDALPHLEKAYNKDKNIDKYLSWYYAEALRYELKLDEAEKMYQEYLSGATENDYFYEEAKLAVVHCKQAKSLLKKERKLPIVNLSKSVNSEYSDYAPVLNKDETKLYFTSRRPGNFGEKKKLKFYDEDIFVSKKVDDAWTVAKRIGVPLNSKGHDASVCFSPDGKTFYIYKHQKQDIFYSEMGSDSIWSKPKRMDIDFNKKKIHEPSVFFAADGKTMYYVSEIDGGFGKKDIFVSKMGEDGKWQKGENLGAEINTPMDEDAPFVTVTGDTLFFSSKGHVGYGGYDIFMCVKASDGKWSEPENVGFPINSSGNDIYFVMTKDGKTGFFSSVRDDSHGSKDIFMASFDKEIFEDDSTDKQDSLLVDNNNKKLIKLSGFITDVQTMVPLDANLVFSGSNNNKNSSSQTDGNYGVELENSGNYFVTITKNGYFPKNMNINIPDGQENNKQDFQLWKESDVIVLKKVYFDFDKSTLRPKGKKTLDKLVKFLQDYPNMKFEIGGHTDSWGSNSYNLSLSDRRAKTVYEYLKEHGIADLRMTYKGYGETKPADTNATATGRQNNRRMEVKFDK